MNLLLDLHNFHPMGDICSFHHKDFFYLFQHIFQCQPYFETLFRIIGKEIGNFVEKTQKVSIDPFTDMFHNKMKLLDMDNRHSTFTDLILNE